MIYTCREHRTQMRHGQQCPRCLDQKWRPKTQAERREPIDQTELVRNALRGAVELHRTALHEAAHAVALIVLGYPIGGLQVSRGGTGRTTRGDDQDMTLADRLLVAAVGDAAERMHYADDTHTEDHDLIQQLLDDAGLVDTVTVDDVDRRADQFALDHRAAIERLADVASGRRTMDAADIAAIVAEHTEPPAYAEETRSAFHDHDREWQIGDRVPPSMAHVIGFDEQGRAVLDSAECRAYWSGR